MRQLISVLLGAAVFFRSATIKLFVIRWANLPTITDCPGYFHYTTLLAHLRVSRRGRT
jgi:hypothetical protein